MSFLPTFNIPDFSQNKFEYESDENGDTTTASLEQYYEQLKGTWEVGEQTATLEGTPITRMFSQLTFESGADSVTLVDLGYNSEEYEGRYYYRVIHRFYEDEYFSSNSNSHENFRKWELSKNTYIQEIIYAHKLVNTLTWNRPYYTVPCITSNTSGDNSGGQTQTTGCTPLSIIQPTTNSTGRGNPVTKDNVQIQYNPLDIPYKRILKCGKALGAIVESDGNFILKLKSDADSVDFQQVNNTEGRGTTPLLLIKPYLEVEFTNPTQYLPTYIKVNLYGEEMWRSHSSITIDEEPEILIHSASVTSLNKLKPPGKSHLPDNFWNSNPNVNPFEDYSNRQGQSTEWL